MAGENEGPLGTHVPEVHEHTISYEDIDGALGAIGGIQGLLVMVPAMLPNVGEDVMSALENGIRTGAPVDMRLDAPGLSYVVHLRAAS